MKAPTPVRTLVPAGTHVARIYQIIYLGTTKGEFKGQPIESFKVRITWELPNELHQFKDDKPEKPFVVSKEYTLSMGKKSNLRPLVEGIIGTSLDDEEAAKFDIDELLGMSCQLSITHAEGQNGKYAKINSASTLMKGVSCPPPVNTPKILSYEKWDNDLFLSLPDFIKEKIEKTPEFRKMNGQEVSQNIETEAIDPDDLPF